MYKTSREVVSLLFSLLSPYFRVRKEKETTKKLVVLYNSKVSHATIATKPCNYSHSAVETTKLIICFYIV